MSSRGSRGRGGGGGYDSNSGQKGGRGGGGGGGGGRYSERDTNNRSNNNSSSYASNSAAPPPSIDESPVRNGVTGGGGGGRNKEGKGARNSNNNTNGNSNIGTPTVVSPPEPVGPTPTKFGPQSLSPLNADAITRTQTPPSTTQPRSSISGFSVDASPREQRESSLTHEKPPTAPSHRSSFEVTAQGGASAGTPYAGPPTPQLMGLNISSPVDRDVFVAAKAAVHNAPRPVLAALLNSILDDYPTLGPIIKYRYERAISAVATQQLMAQQQQQQQQLPPNIGYWAGGGSLQTSNGNDSPSRKRSFRGRGGHEDDQQQICGVHGALRSIKHLRIADNGMFECVPGFHCLESSKENSNCVSPVKGEREHSYHGSGAILQATAGPFVPAGTGRSYSSPPSPPPGVIVEPFVVQGLFQPSGNQAQGMVRQNTLPPSQRRTDEDDNLEELLKNLHLATTRGM
eukprot:GILI01014977.1.p1 GENE.GILI01014977.1~~GILI01014977.1.p1  ORF type:complete len:457 (-),score=102.91 GILI01014977.1:217-1587(-)